MSSQPKIRNTLQDLPFYNEEIKNINKNISNNKLLSVLPFLFKKGKKSTHKQLSEILRFHPKRKKSHKKLTKRQILQKMLPLSETLNIIQKDNSYGQNKFR